MLLRDEKDWKEEDRMNHSIKDSINQSINQSIRDSINQRLNQSINQSINRLNQSTQSIDSSNQSNGTLRIYSLEVLTCTKADDHQI